MKRFRGGLVFKAHRLLYHSTLGLSVIKKTKKRKGTSGSSQHAYLCLASGLRPEPASDLSGRLFGFWILGVGVEGLGFRMCGLWFVVWGLASGLRLEAASDSGRLRRGFTYEV